MHRAMLICLFLIALTLGGCALMNKIAPSQVDANGAPIPATHTLTPIADATTKAIPYGEASAGAVLLVWNMFERIRANKVGNGLMATIRAIEKAGEDPATAEAIAKLKEELSHAHDVANVQPLIKAMLAKV